MKTTAIAILISLSATFLCGCRRPSTERDTAPGLESVCRQDSDSKALDDTSIRIIRDTVKSDISGVDSMIVFSLQRNKRKEPLFRLAKGGNIECIADSFLCIGNHMVSSLKFSDYSQVDQIFFILFDCDRDTFVQSGRINLPYLGMTMDDSGSLCVDSISADSIYIDGPVDIATEALRLDCDSNRVINYYEYQ